MNVKPRRSVLYMPASNERALEKAKTLAADVVVFDLEDAVAPEAKAQARERACAAVRSGDYGRRELVIRINDPSTESGRADLDSVLQAGPDAVLVPKISTAEEVRSLDARLRAGGAPTALWLMIETPRGVLNAAAIADCARAPESRLACFIIGPNDLAKETGVAMMPGRAPMLAWLSHCVLAAKSAHLVILDGVYNDFRDTAGFEAECVQGRQYGMDGKTLIHPAQIEIANRVFGPSEEEVAWARRVLEIFENPEHRDKGVVQIDGRMVERLHAEMARDVVAMAEAIRARQA
jgi:citrate lyase subunit beta/citryl-CoA lyase